jgi:low affinity Fe/Cu permease
MGPWFTRFASRTAAATGHYIAFVIAFLIIIVWALSGPVFGFSDTWQLVINTGTTIVTFLMVFLIQNTQNRDTKAIHLKLDELIRAMESADDEIISAEDESDETLAELKDQYAALTKEHEKLTQIHSRLEHELETRKATNGARKPVGSGAGQE